MINNQIYIAFYLLGNILSCYAIYKIFNVFFDKVGNKKSLYIVFIAYYIGISALYLGFNNPMLTMISNLVFLGLITCVFKSGIMKKIIAVGLVYAVSFLVECCVVLTAFYLHWSNMEILSMVISRILLMIIAQCLHINSYLKKDILIPKTQWLSIIIFPFGSIILFELIINYTNQFVSLICLIILLIFNLMIFYVFDKLNSEYSKLLSENLKIQEKQFESAMYLREKTIYQNQLQIINDSNEKIKILKHDLKGHFFSLKTLLDKSEYNEALKYIDRINSIIIKDDKYVDTGNATITSILNYYIGEAHSKGIKIEYNLKFPVELGIEHYDLCTILYNLLSNALEASEKCDSNKQIKIELIYSKGMFYIKIKNRFKEKLKIENEKLLTTKQDQEFHGYGMTSVKKSIDKYNGVIDYFTKKDFFEVCAIMYCNN